MKNTDFIRRIDAKKELVGLHADLDAETVQRCIDAIGTVKAADVVPVVRCRDCIYHLYDDEFNHHWCNIGFSCREVKPDDFCSRGQRREITHKVVVAGNCTVCGKPLENGSIFLCDDCKNKNDQFREK